MRRRQLAAVQVRLRQEEGAPKQPFEVLHSESEPAERAVRGACCGIIECQRKRKTLRSARVDTRAGTDSTHAPSDLSPGHVRRHLDGLVAGGTHRAARWLGIWRSNYCLVICTRRPR